MFNDFQKQKDIKFDIIELRQALKQVLNKKALMTLKELAILEQFP